MFIRTSVVCKIKLNFLLLCKMYKISFCVFWILISYVHNILCYELLLLLFFKMVIFCHLKQRVKRMVKNDIIYDYNMNNKEKIVH